GVGVPCPPASELGRFRRSVQRSLHPAQIRASSSFDGRLPPLPRRDGLRIVLVRGSLLDFERARAPSRSLRATPVRIAGYNPAESDNRNLASLGSNQWTSRVRIPLSARLRSVQGLLPTGSESLQSQDVRVGRSSRGGLDRSARVGRTTPGLPRSGSRGE